MKTNAQNLLLVDIDGKSIPVYVTYIPGKTSISLRISYGNFYAKIGSRFRSARGLGVDLAKMIKKPINPGYTDLSYSKMLDWKAKTVYVLGVKKNIVRSPIESFNEPYWFFPEGHDFTKDFDERFILYLRNRLSAEAKRGDIPLKSDFSVKLGKFESIYANYNFAKNLFKFDRRLFAFTPEVIDSIVDHELCHVLYHNHGPKFKIKLNSLMPHQVYRRCRWILATGRFTDTPLQKG